MQGWNLFKADTTNRIDDPEEIARRGRRLSLSCRAFFCNEDHLEGEARLLDISRCGCRIASDESLRLCAGMLLKLCLFLPDYSWTMHIEEAFVRWVVDEQVGLEFTSIRGGQRERLRALLMKGR